MVTGKYQEISSLKWVGYCVHSYFIFQNGLLLWYKDLTISSLKSLYSNNLFIVPLLQFHLS